MKSYMPIWWKSFGKTEQEAVIEVERQLDSLKIPQANREAIYTHMKSEPANAHQVMQ